MSKYQKQQQNTPTKSHYEEQWTFTDYFNHDDEFNGILTEYRELLKIAKGSAVMTRWLWLEKQGVVKMTERNGVVEPLIKSGYQTESARFDRFTEWLSFKEKKITEKNTVPPAEVESLEKMASEIADKMTIRQPFNN